MFAKVLVANRGEIACRLIRTLDRLKIASVAVYSDADRHAPHVRRAGQAVRIGAGPAAGSYLDQSAVLEAALATGAQAIHPGYGFLSENAHFAQACRDSGLTFIGPTPSQMRDFGLKHRARELAAKVGVPLLPGSGLLDSLEEAQREAARIGYPVMLKSTAGGGGIGMSLVRAETDLAEAFLAVERLARKNFSRGGVFLEKYIERARHIEVQIFGDGAGTVVALGERDCSTQRRNQKIIEETPAAGIPADTRARLHASAVRLASAVGYESAGTVEYVYDVADAEFYFLEVNTRLQVEHGVTEEVLGIDLVEWMVRQAAGERFDLRVPARAAPGAAIEVRVYAEDPARGFRPAAGLVTQARFPAGVRVETWIADGTEVTPLYDPLLAKIIASGGDRAEALGNLRHALQRTTIAGIETNLEYLRDLLDTRLFASGAMTTRALEGFVFAPRSIEVLAGGTQSTLQDHPGRIGYWNVGVPPSGPMDDLSFRLVNRAVGNPAGSVALEMTVSGPTLKFDAPALVCLGGAHMSAQLEGRAVPYWTPVAVRAGEVLRIGSIEGAGARAYLSVRGGFDVPAYLGSRATFTLGKFGGHGGRALQGGDVLHVAPPDAATTGRTPAQVPSQCRPRFDGEWDLGALYGPHGAPDFFTDADIAAFFAATWTVHYNSSRTGVRLIGPKPTWARSDGGEAGLHPSNIHDNAYAIGAVDFTGDMPVILGPDGPSLGGFVCPATVASSQRWKLGQLRLGDRLRFVPWTLEQAAAAEAAQERSIEEPAAALGSAAFGSATFAAAPLGSAVLGTLAASSTGPAVVYRLAGDRNVLIEYGPPVLDLELRLRVHALMSRLEAAAVPGIVEATPGIRSLQVHYDGRVLPLARLLEVLQGIERSLGAIDDIAVATRVVRLPLSWDDAATQLAIAKYMQSVRADAPWCPSNIEFIRRINGLPSIEDVKRIVFEASYLVLGLGDVYLGAPVATPVDPRHRLVTTKYNPARTWTPENAVGIGGAYLCVYGMEGPGGYQFVGRTCQMWNTYRVSRDFRPGRPWLLRCFDQVRFYPVSGEELLQFRDDFLHGRVELDMREETFRLRDHREFLRLNAADIAVHKLRQQSAFEDERARWERSGRLGDGLDAPQTRSGAERGAGAGAGAGAEDDDARAALADGHLAVASPVSGSVWKLAAAVGDRVEAGAVLVIVESMKMELPVTAPVDGIVTHVRCAEGRAVTVAQTLVVLKA